MESIKDFNKSFKAMQLLALISLAGFVLATIIYVVLYHRVQQYYQHQTYVITSWGSFPAQQYNGRDLSRVEVKNHLETFLKFMFAHNAETYYDHINLALNLIDEASGKRIFHDFEQGEVHKNYVRYGSHTEIKIDSVVIDMNQMPVKAWFYAQQQVHIGSNVRSLPIAGSMQIVQDYRHEKNPYGLLITDFDFISYPRKTKK